MAFAATAVIVLRSEQHQDELEITSLFVGFHVLHFESCTERCGRRTLNLLNLSWSKGSKIQIFGSKEYAEAFPTVALQLRTQLHYFRLTNCTGH